MMRSIGASVGLLLFGVSAADAQVPAPSAADFAAALDVPAADVVSATFDADSDALSRQITQAYGVQLVPRQGPTMVLLSTGRARDANDPGFVPPDPGTSWGLVTSPNPHPDPAAYLRADGTICQGSVGPPSVHDLTELRLTLQVPAGSAALSFDLNFITAEYPEAVCSQTVFPDRFVALLETAGATTNVATDGEGRAISSTSVLYLVGAGGPGQPPGPLGTSQLQGTGMPADSAGGTSWLTITAAVPPGDTITLRFLLFEEADGAVDSVTLIDNFRWLSPGIHVSPPAVAFGDLVVGQTADVVASVQNTGDSPLQIGQIGGEDGLLPPYAFGADTCSLQSLPPLSRCSVAVRFQPTQAGTFTDGFNVPSNDPGSPDVVVPVVGRAIPAPGVGGTAVQLTVKTVHCLNVRTRKSVRITLNGSSSSWDCERAGLRVNPGDPIVMTITGQAQ